MQLSSANQNTITRTDSLHRIYCLDGIRAMAALMVMISHFIGHHGETKAIIQTSVIGQTGVDLFFVLSGFLITRILLLSRESPHFFKAFYARRTLRISPLYFGFLAVYFFLLPPMFGLPIPAFSSQLWSWFYLQNLPATFTNLRSTGPGHFWSLAIEEHFYLVWPLIVFSLSRSRFQILIWATLIVPLVLRFILLRHGIGVFFFTLTRVDALGYGALLAVLLTDEAWTLRHARMFRPLMIVIGALLLPSFVLFSGSGCDWLQTVKLTLIPAFYFALIGFCVADPAARPLTSLFSVRWLRWLGAISYGLYVFHPTCFALVQRFAAPSSFFIDFTMSFALTIGVAYLSFRFFEAPILKLKRHFRYEINTGLTKREPV